jgi:hypothetical protein
MNRFTVTALAGALLSGFAGGANADLPTDQQPRFSFGSSDFGAASAATISALNAAIPTNLRNTVSFRDGGGIVVMDVPLSVYEDLQAAKDDTYRLASTFTPINNATLGLVRFSLAPITSNGETSVQFSLDTRTPTTAWTRAANVSLDINEVRFNLDPSISYSYSVTDFGTASTFVTGLSMPMVPTIGATGTYVESSMSATLTDSTRNGISLTPTGPGGAVQTSYFGSAGVGGALTQYSALNLGATPFSHGAVGAGAPNTYLYGPYAVGDVESGSILGPDGPLNAMRIQANFRLSGGGDSISISGRTEIVPIPEPSTYAMIGVGLGMVGFALRRPRRRIRLG